MTGKGYMLADQQQVFDAPIDDACLLGRWVNLNPDTRDFKQLTVSAEGDDYFVEFVTARKPGALPPVNVNIYRANGTNLPHGFYANVRYGTLRVHVAADKKMGIYIVQTYVTAADHKTGIFSKEYFRAYRSDEMDGPVHG